MIKKKNNQIQTYLEDTSNIQGKASSLYLPQSRGEVVALIKELAKKRIPFTIAGGRTGTTGGCVPQEGVLISLERLNAIIDFDSQRRFLRVEAGVTLEQLESKAQGSGLTLRASPTESLACIGGAVSTAASGVRGFGYGSIRTYITDLEVLLTTGDIIAIKRGDFFAAGRHFDFYHQDRHIDVQMPSYSMPAVKSQAGFFVKDNMDFIDVFIGSEGVLGIILSCGVNLQPCAFTLFDGLIFFRRQTDAFNFVEKIKALKIKGVLAPAALEFFDIYSLRMLKERYSFIPDAEAGVYFEQEAKTSQEAERYLDIWQELIEEHNALTGESILADTPGERKRIFEFRHALPQMINEFLRQHHQIKASSDIAVPDKHLRQMYDFYQTSARESGIDSVNFGHIGESHLHFNFLPRTRQQYKKAREYMYRFCQRAVSFGGTVSAEHGIGKLKKEYLEILYDRGALLEMAKLKKYFDPSCLLGLDTLIDKELLPAS